MRISDWSSDVCSSDLVSEALLLEYRRSAVRVLGALTEALLLDLEAVDPAVDDDHQVRQPCRLVRAAVDLDDHRARVPLLHGGLDRLDERCLRLYHEAHAGVEPAYPDLQSGPSPLGQWAAQIGRAHV